MIHQNKLKNGLTANTRQSWVTPSQNTRKMDDLISDLGLRFICDTEISNTGSIIVWSFMKYNSLQNQKEKENCFRNYVIIPKKIFFSLFLLLFDFIFLQWRDFEALEIMFSRKINYVHNGQMFVTLSYFCIAKA